MMRTFPRPTERASSERGFTLIEMLVVLTIVALVAVVGAVTLQRKPGSLTRQRAAIQVKAAALDARRLHRST
jgi:prepilin-type N-terminal cleavage/methylation domain-containing protein